MLNHRRWSIAVIGLLIVSALPMISTSSRANAPERELVQQTVLHPTGDYLTTGWTPNPEWTQLLTNDGLTTCIWTAGTYQFYSPTMTTFTDPGYANETFEVTAWAVLKHNLPMPSEIGIRKTTTSWYTGSNLMREGPTTPNAWLNVTITAVRCPWTNTNWTVSQINLIHCVVASQGTNTTVTEMGMLINTTIPVTTAPTIEYVLSSTAEISFGALAIIALIGGCIALVWWLK